MKRYGSYLLTFLLSWLIVTVGADADVINNPTGGGGSSTVTPTGGTAANTPASIFGRQLSVLDFGAKCDGKVLNNVTTTAASGTVSSASYTFTAADVGKMVTSASGTLDATTTGSTTAGRRMVGVTSVTGIHLGDYVVGTGIPAGSIVVSINTVSNTAVTISNIVPATTGSVSLTFYVPQNTTIASVSAGNAVLASNATTSRAGNDFFTFGTDDSTTINTAVSTLGALPNAGTLTLPRATCVVAASITWASNVSLTGQGAGKSILKWISTGNQATGVIHAPGSATYAAPLVNTQFTYFEIDLSAAQAPISATAAKGIEMPFTANSVVDHVFVHDSPATCIATDYGNPTYVTNNTLGDCGRLVTTAQGGNGIGEGISSANAEEQYVITGNTVYNVQHSGILLETQNATTSTTTHAVISGNIITDDMNSDATVPEAAAITDSGATGTIITNNKIYGYSGSGNWNGICVDRGTYTVSGPVPGVQTLIGNNYVGGNFTAGITIRYSTVDPNPVQAAKIMIVGNHIDGAIDRGIKLLTGTTNAMDTIVVNDNIVSLSGGAGLLALGTGAFQNLVIENNVFSNNGATTGTVTEQAGISISAPVSNFTMQGNTAFDNKISSQKYGFAIASGFTVTNATITDNNFKNNTTSGFDLVGTLSASWVANNTGYNPIGASAVTPGASPWTYTAGNTPETLYLSGGTISSVTKNGVTLATTLPALSPLSITLDPGESVIVTYTVVPTANKDQK